MVGDDERKPLLLILGDEFAGGDAVVNGDDERNAFSQKGVQGLGVHAVAFFEATWDVDAHVGIEPGKCFAHEGCGADAVNVVVAIDGDAVFCLEGFCDNVHGGAKIWQLEGTAEVFHFCVQKCRRLLRRGIAATGEDSRQWQRQPQRVG